MHVFVLELGTEIMVKGCQEKIPSESYVFNEELMATLFCNNPKDERESHGIKINLRKRWRVRMDGEKIGIAEVSIDLRNVLFLFCIVAG